MNGIILCEGFDDVLLLGYYLYKSSDGIKWKYENNEKISDNFDFPKINSKSEKRELYRRGGDNVALWCVGGKDNFGPALQFIHTVNTHFPESGFQKLAIVTDRDDNDIGCCLDKMHALFLQQGWSVCLENNKENAFFYDVEGERFEITIAPIIIPFTEPGAIETIMVNAIGETGSEEHSIVNRAKEYVHSFVSSGNLTKYLQHKREIPKAILSSIISITNPDRSTAYFNELLISNDWEKKEIVKTHFGLLKTMFI